MPNGLQPLRKVSLWVRCMLAFYCWCLGSFFLVLGIRANLFCALAGIWFLGLGSFALWLWPRWNFEPRLRRVRDLYIALGGLMATLGLHALGLWWVALATLVGLILGLVSRRLWLRHRRENLTGNGDLEAGSAF
jgi:hypothetical protein